MDTRASFRVTALIAALGVVLCLFVIRLYSIQVSKTNATVTQTENYTFRYTVTAARGNILDRNGNLLVANRASYNIQVNNMLIYSKQDTNENIVTLLNMLDVYGLEHTDHLPISQEQPYTLTLETTDTIWQTRFKTFMNERDWDVDITAASLMKLLRKAYSITDEYTDEQARQIIGIRYELELRSYDYSLDNYILCYDVPTDALASISELNVPGVSVETTSIREYYTTYAAHILGTVGKMTASEYEYYKDLGYAMDANVGKDGLELAFEEYLHGTDGVLYREINADGNTVSEYYTTEPVTGYNIETTIDLTLQEAAEDALAAYIEDLRVNGIPTSTENNGNGMDAEGGAVVIESVKTGEILACCSYPTFNLATYSEDFEDLLTEEYNPIYNRALLAIYNPGSTFKPVTGIATVDYLGVSPHMQIEDLGIFEKYKDQGFTPQCMSYKNYRQTHGMLDLVRALTVSCNYYFYVMGDDIYLKSNGTWQPIDDIAKALGLGEHTGIELYENTGYRANAATKEMLYSDTDDQGFFAADAVLAAIGQSENKFTPIQLVSYCSALANRGVRYRCTFLSRVISSDYSRIVEETEPEILSTLQASDTAWDAIYDGMYGVANDAQEGTARKALADYSVKVCAKTGTAEQDSGGSSNSAFICYAPADDPEIAIAIYIEKGGSGGAMAYIARDILDVYFNMDTEDSGSSYEYVLPEAMPQ